MKKDVILLVVVVLVILIVLVDTGTQQNKWRHRNHERFITHELYINEILIHLIMLTLYLSYFPPDKN